MDLKQLEYFVQIASLRGFNRAATHLHIAQSALSRQVRQLEDELGVDLLIRDRAGLQLTRAGELLLEQANSLLQQFRRVRDDVIAEGTVPRGELVIGIPQSLRFMIAAPLLRQFGKQHAAVRIRTWVAPGVVLRDLVLGGTVDIAVTAASEPDVALDSQPLMRESLVLVGPRSSPLARATVVDWNRVITLPLILPSHPSTIRVLVEEAAAKRGVSLNVLTEINDISLIVELVLEGGGFTLVPYSAVHAAVSEKKVLATGLESVCCAWDITHLREKPLSPAARCARDLLREIVAKRIQLENWPHAQLLNADRAQLVG
jgi:LysR family transcriptional regulator, nitrogen assimilation regulatory protein